MGNPPVTHPKRVSHRQARSGVEHHTIYSVTVNLLLRKARVREWMHGPNRVLLSQSRVSGDSQWHSFTLGCPYNNVLGYSRCVQK